MEYFFAAEIGVIRGHYINKINQHIQILFGISYLHIQSWMWLGSNHDGWSLPSFVWLPWFDFFFFSRKVFVEWQRDSEHYFYIHSSISFRPTLIYCIHTPLNLSPNPYRKLIMIQYFVNNLPQINVPSIVQMRNIVSIKLLLVHQMANVK